MSDTNQSLAKATQEEYAAMKAALDDAVQNARIQMMGGIPDPLILDAVRDLCEKHGYGNVMATASMLWRAKDLTGAYACGPCIGSVEHFLKLADLADSLAQGGRLPDAAGKP